MSKSPQPKRRATTNQAVPSWFLTLVTLVILLGLVWFGRGFLIPIVIATFFLVLIVAVNERLESVTIAGRSVPNKVSYAITILFIFLVVIGLGNLISNQAVAISESVPRYEERVASLKGQIDGLLGAERVASLERAIANADINSLLAKFAQSAAGAFGNAALVLLYLAFMLAERGAFIAKLPSLCTTKAEANRMKESLRSISFGIRQYVWINTLTSSMSATLAFVVLKIVGADFAPSLALLVFLLSFIPTLGSVLCIVILVLFSLLQFDTITPALIVAVVYGGGDAIIGNVLQPKLQGKSLNMSALMVMMALSFWSMVWGGVGAFMAVPLTVVIMIVCAQIPILRPFAILLSSDGVARGDTKNNVKPAIEQGPDKLGKSKVQPEGPAL
ncbi:MAG: AI-2E family transporter [Rhizobiaceae bacterium]